MNRPADGEQPALGEYDDATPHRRTGEDVAQERWVQPSGRSIGSRACAREPRVASRTVRSLNDDELAQAAAPGVGPHGKPWPDDPRLDPELLATGDRRNVADRYRYWRLEAIVADLDTRRHPLRIAIQNWEHDFNIGSMVRTANAFNVAGVHILGRRRWNRRGAMVTDRYCRRAPFRRATRRWLAERLRRRGRGQPAVRPSRSSRPTCRAVWLLFGSKVLA